MTKEPSVNHSCNSAYIYEQVILAYVDSEGPDQAPGL